MSLFIYGLEITAGFAFMATAWPRRTMGILVLMDHDINIVNNAIVILLMVIGVADGVRGGTL